VRTPPADGPIVLGLTYPTSWLGGEEAVRATVAEIEAVDPRVEVVVEAYHESQQLRTLRGRPEGIAEARALVPEPTDVQRAMFARVHGVVAIDLPFDVGDLAPDLAWVQAVGAGTAQLQSAGLAAAGIRLTSAAGANAIGIAEFVLGRILAERKRFREIEAAQTRGVWEPLYGSELAGATVGLIGLGAINSAVARRLAAFDVTVLACRRSAGPGAMAPHVDELFPTSRLHAMLGRCDIVVAAVPETADTIGMMDAAAIAAMPAGSFLVNVGRGTLLDETALVDALRRGHLRGAALDVQHHEPLPADDPLWDAPNLYLSAHCSASPAALFPNLQRLWKDNIRRWLAGEPLVNEVVEG
jgi:phosphoglycerate dehydrogenase-like enzyme